MKKWLWACLMALTVLAMSVASAESVPLASETEISPVLEAQELVGLKIPVEVFKETTRGDHDLGDRRGSAVCQRVRLHLSR